MSRNHSPSLEGARGVAALTVLTFHAVVFSDDPGFLGVATARFWLGVPLFFLLSGFLLFRPMAHATIFLEKRPSLARYARSRVLRIIPAYWVALTVTIFLLYQDARSVAVAAVALCSSSDTSGQVEAQCSRCSSRGWRSGRCTQRLPR